MKYIIGYLRFMVAIVFDKNKYTLRVVFKMRDRAFVVAKFECADMPETVHSRTIMYMRLFKCFGL
jgi:hypothetical protein